MPCLIFKYKQQMINCLIYDVFTLCSKNFFYSQILESILLLTKQLPIIGPIGTWTDPKYFSFLAWWRQVEVGDYSPTTPTDPDVQISRIRFLSLWFR